MSTSNSEIEKNILRTDAWQEDRLRQEKAGLVVNLGLGANAVLAVTKLSAGILGHSQALLADGINSLSDVVYFIIVRILVTLSGKPSDDEHPYGHHQFESIAALVVGAFVITTGLAIFWDSINKVFDLCMGRMQNDPISTFTLIVAAGTVIIKIMLMLQAKTIGARIQSIAVMALARDHRNDIFASAGAGIGILCGILGHAVFDPIAGAVVAVIVVKTGADILRESANELMDTVPSKEIDRKIRGLVGRISGVQTVESVHAHRFGPYFVANITIGVDGRQTVDEGNEIADAVEKYLCEKIDLLRKVYIHYHPAHADDGRPESDHFKALNSGTRESDTE
ncbi:MAG: cation transporter [Deltaproteobacteria bacterium]|nr:cation transporter [Deltaproteobacteria bacterium]